MSINEAGYFYLFGFTPQCGRRMTMTPNTDVIHGMCGTLPAAAPSPLDGLRASLQASPELVWAWHCNLAMPIMDELNCTHEQANRAAARLMRALFDVDVTAHEYWLLFPWAHPGYDANGSPVDDTLDALDAMADGWAQRVNLPGMVANIPVDCRTPEFQARVRACIEALMHLAYVEGLYQGRTSHHTQAANEQLSRDLIEAARDARGG